MLYDGIELDLEDIEAHLYSQVFHSNNQETGVELLDQDLIDNMRPPNRYFQSGRTSKFINNVNSSNSNNKKQKSQIKTTNYMKPTTQRQQREITTTTTTTINQVVLVNPFNNIVCLKEIKKQKRKQNKRARNKEKRRAARLQLKLQKVLQNAKPIKPPPPPLIINSVDIITLSDSENEDKSGEIKEEPKLMSQISKNTSPNCSSNDNTTNDDVIFVEPPPIEVINLTEESPDKKSTDIDSASLKSDQKYRPHERKELLSTPESTTSNDFMENPNIDLQQNQFNFSLHGVDFVNNNKPTTSTNNNDDNDVSIDNRNAEICETESTCSTIDVNSLKTTVFKEVEFPKEDLFSEANLENFGNLITPNRTNKTRIETSTPIQMLNNNKTTYNRSDSSSSESDYDDNQLQIDKIKKQMNLPNLSPITNNNNNNNNDDDDSKSNIGKKTKTPKIGSKFDLIENEKKTKKRKSSESNNNSDRKKMNKNKRRKSENMEKSCNKDNSIIDNQQESDVLILEASHNESIDNYSENTIKPNDGGGGDNNNNIDDNNDKSEEILRDFVIVDEVNNTDNEPITVSESESELSAINEQECHDIKLINCSNIDKQPINNQNVDNNKKVEVNLKNSTLLEVQQAMSDDPKLWEISERDRNYIRKSGPTKRCAKCREIGHISIRCPNRRDPPKCRLCGGRGHLVYRCPNTMCVQCGTPGNSSTYCTHCYKFREFYCNICGMTGHIKDRCPDLWRRYHLTTENGPLITRQGASLKPKEHLWCSSCARSGHLEHVCNFTYTPYAKYDPQIYYYHDIYENFENIEQLYPSTDNYHQFNHQTLVQYPRERYFDRQRYYNYNKEYGDVDNGRIESNTNVEAYYNNNNQSGFFNSQQNSPYHQQYENRIKRENHYYIFHNKSFSSLSYFLRTELRNLHALYRDIENVVRNLKNSFNEQSHIKVGSFYRLLNMTLFGIYCFDNGKMHLQRLENSHSIPRKNKLMTRRNLYKSYCFIFSSNRHDNVDYRGLLSRI